MASLSNVKQQSANNYKYTMANKDYEALARSLGNKTYTAADEAAYRQKHGIDTTPKNQPTPAPTPTPAPKPATTPTSTAAKPAKATTSTPAKATTTSTPAKTTTTTPAKTASTPAKATSTTPAKATTSTTPAKTSTPAKAKETTLTKSADTQPVLKSATPPTPAKTYAAPVVAPKEPVITGVGGYVVTMSHKQQNEFVRRNQSRKAQGKPLLSEDEYRREQGLPTDRQSNIKYTAPKLTSGNKSAASTGNKSTGVSNNLSGSEKIAAQSKTNADTNKATVTNKSSSTPATKTVVSLSAAASGNAAKTSPKTTTLTKSADQPIVLKKPVISLNAAKSGNAAKTSPKPSVQEQVQTAKKTIISRDEASSGKRFSSTVTKDQIRDKNNNVINRTEQQGNNGTEGVKIYTANLSAAEKAQNLAAYQQRTGLGEAGYKSGSTTKTVENKNAAAAREAAREAAAKTQALQAAFTGNTKLGPNGVIIDAIQAKGINGAGERGVSIITKNKSGELTGISKSQSQFKAEAKQRTQIANIPLKSGMSTQDIATIKQARAEVQARSPLKQSYSGDDRWADPEDYDREYKRIEAATKNMSMDEKRSYLKNTVTNQMNGKSTTQDLVFAKGTRFEKPIPKIQAFDVINAISAKERAGEALTPAEQHFVNLGNQDYVESKPAKWINTRLTNAGEFASKKLLSLSGNEKYQKGSGWSGITKNEATQDKLASTWTSAREGFYGDSPKFITGFGSLIVTDVDYAAQQLTKRGLVTGGRNIGNKVTADTIGILGGSVDAAKDDPIRFTSGMVGASAITAGAKGSVGFAKRRAVNFSKSTKGIKIKNDIKTTSKTVVAEITQTGPKHVGLKNQETFSTGVADTALETTTKTAVNNIISRQTKIDSAINVWNRGKYAGKAGFEEAKIYPTVNAKSLNVDVVNAVNRGVTRDNAVQVWNRGRKAGNVGFEDMKIYPEVNAVSLDANVVNSVNRGLVRDNAIHAWNKGKNAGKVDLEDVKIYPTVNAKPLASDMVNTVNNVMIRNNAINAWNKGKRAGFVNLEDTKIYPTVNAKPLSINIVRNVNRGVTRDNAIQAWKKAKNAGKVDLEDVKIYPEVNAKPLTISQKYSASSVITRNNAVNVWNKGKDAGYTGKVDYDTTLYPGKDVIRAKGRKTILVERNPLPATESAAIKLNRFKYSSQPGLREIELVETPDGLVLKEFAPKGKVTAAKKLGDQRRANKSGVSKSQEAIHEITLVETADGIVVKEFAPKGKVEAAKKLGNQRRADTKPTKPTKTTKSKIRAGSDSGNGMLLVEKPKLIEKSKLATEEIPTIDLSKDLINKPKFRQLKRVEQLQVEEIKPKEVQIYRRAAKVELKAKEELKTKGVQLKSSTPKPTPFGAGNGRDNNNRGGSGLGWMMYKPKPTEPKTAPPLKQKQTNDRARNGFFSIPSTNPRPPNPYFKPITNSKIDPIPSPITIITTKQDDVVITKPVEVPVTKPVEVPITKTKEEQIQKEEQIPKEKEKQKLAAVHGEKYSPILRSTLGEDYPVLPRKNKNKYGGRSWSISSEALMVSKTKVNTFAEMMGHTGEKKVQGSTVKVTKTERASPFNKKVTMSTIQSVTPTAFNRVEKPLLNKVATVAKTPVKITVQKQPQLAPRSPSKMSKVIQKATQKTTKKSPFGKKKVRSFT